MRCCEAASISMQDIPRSTDHAPSKTFYTFRADTEAAFRAVQHDVVHALLNLRLRYEHEMKQQSEVRALALDALRHSASRMLRV